MLDITREDKRDHIFRRVILGPFLIVQCRAGGEMFSHIVEELNNHMDAGIEIHNIVRNITLLTLNVIADLEGQSKEPVLSGERCIPRRSSGS